MTELNPASPPVLLAAALIVSPALWDALVVGSMPLDTALTRFLLAVVAAWVVLSVAANLLPARAPVKKDEPDVNPAPKP
ncbi:MAG TPA: hypothetical protein VIR30_05905 [Nocardioides sp.]|jgi:hypothetical protein|uniref:Uncharacterized protein n=1 Tax=Nocardioides daedukensis TaxID=634462 RepID=A0A7Y9UNN4_9ACTN|nr:hypothetical protein [Nocardioides daedukensis]NYG58738.1 hypothetical protein [Nocardioides daedukensis]